jgi:hypothetical protein
MWEAEQTLGQPFEVEELEATRAIVDALPFEDTSWTIATDHEVLPEVVQITPPRWFEPWWALWKSVDGRIIVEAAGRHDELGNHEVDCERYGRMADALAAIRKELMAG